MEIIDVGLEFNDNYDERSIESINRIILHHTGVTVEQSVEVIHNYHKSRGYAGIGYHFYVRKDGSIYKGRPIEWVGAHAYGNNSDSIGVCAEGNFNEEDMSNEQKASLKELVAYLKNEYGIDLVQAHRDVDSTSCPGENYPFDEIANVEPGPGPEPQPLEYSFEDFVKDVQKAEGQTGEWIDGIVGRKTFELTPTVSSKFNRYHAIVTPLERWLKILGYYDGPIEEDEGEEPEFGAGMREAVIQYQKDNDCVADGEITSKNKTWKKLLQLL